MGHTCYVMFWRAQMFDYLKDGINPRGAEYGATERAADAAQRSADATDDLLALQLADPADRPAIAARINARRAKQMSRRVWWHRLDLILSAAFVAGIALYMLTPSGNTPQSAVTGDAPASVSTVTDNAPAPESSAQAPDAAGSDNPEAVVAQGERVLHEAGFSDKQIRSDSATQ